MCSLLLHWVYLLSNGNTWYYWWCIQNVSSCSVGSYHLKLFKFCRISVESQAACGIVRLNFSSLWMLLNAFRFIKSGWLFQLNCHVTGNVCLADIDLFEMFVTSMPCQNNTLCIAIIPRKTKPETTYKITLDDLSKAVCKVPTMVNFGSADCKCCKTISICCVIQMSSNSCNPRDSETSSCLLLVDSWHCLAMCYNFVELGNFAEKCLGIPINVCMPHGTGNCLYTLH